MDFSENAQSGPFSQIHSVVHPCFWDLSRPLGLSHATLWYNLPPCLAVLPFYVCVTPTATYPSSDKPFACKTSREDPVATSFCFWSSFAFLIAALALVCHFRFLLSLFMDRFCLSVCRLCLADTIWLSLGAFSVVSVVNDSLGVGGGEPAEPNVSLLYSLRALSAMA